MCIFDAFSFYLSGTWGLMPQACFGFVSNREFIFLKFIGACLGVPNLLYAKKFSEIFSYCESIPFVMKIEIIFVNY